MIFILKSIVDILYESVLIPFENAIPRNTVNKLMARTSSHEDAAITKVGMPCSTPNPCSCNSSNCGTTIAGDTAPRTNLKHIKLKCIP